MPPSFFFLAPAMGNETSTPQDEPAPSPQPETPPFQYASYSKEKPEEGGKKSSSLPQKANPQDNFITVSTSKRTRKPDKTLEALDAIPKFLPILRSSLGAGQQGQENATIDHKQLICVCNRYQDHLTRSAAVVDESQTKINERMKWVSKNAGARASRFGKIAQKMQKSADKIIDVGKLQEKITKMVDTINLVLLPRMQELNSALPPELQLEPFQYSFDSTQLSPINLDPEAAAAAAAAAAEEPVRYFGDLGAMETESSDMAMEVAGLWTRLTAIQGRTAAIKTPPGSYPAAAAAAKQPVVGHSSW